MGSEEQVRKVGEDLRSTSSADPVAEWRPGT